MHVTAHFRPPAGFPSAIQLYCEHTDWNHRSFHLCFWVWIMWLSENEGAHQSRLENKTTITQKSEHQNAAIGWELNFKGSVVGF